MSAGEENSLHNVRNFLLHQFISTVSAFIDCLGLLTDLESMTLRAGYARSISEFVEMLSQAFTDGNEQLSVDVLTSTDLAVMKAKRTGQPQSTPQESTNTPQYQKRIVVLNYRGPFDKKCIHFPLTLLFEEKPNPAALKRTIARLRKKIVDMQRQESEPSTDKERYSG